MINLHDKANELGKLLQASEEYLAFQKVKSEVYEDEANRKMIEDYKALQFEAQATMLAGQEPPAELMDKIRKVGEVLQFNPKITEFFTLEYKFNTLVSDLYKLIFGGVTDIGMEE